MSFRTRARTRSPREAPREPRRSQGGQESSERLGPRAKMRQGLYTNQAKRNARPNEPDPPDEADT
eukprot:12424844-Karenia_brevis.AAC.1